MRFTYIFDVLLTILLEMHGESSAVLVDRMMEADGSCKASACRFPHAFSRVLVMQAQNLSECSS